MFIEREMEPGRPPCSYRRPCFQSDIALLAEGGPVVSGSINIALLTEGGPAPRVMVVCWYDWDWESAEREAKRAITLNPNSSEAHRADALLLSALGRQKEAIVAAARARELDPLALLTR